jgi:hypothetical protein
MRLVRHMAKANILGSAVVGLLSGLWLSCDPSTTKLQFSDTEQRRFEVSCNKGKEDCSYRRVTGRAVSEDKQEVELSTAGRVVGVCDVSASNGPLPGDCRAIVCKADEHCPPLHRLETGHCLNGLCISPENDLSPSDAVMLCLAGSGLGRNAPKQVARYAMGLNCGKPCKIPTLCRQP